MDTDKLHDIIKEQLGGLINHVLTIVQVALDNPDQFAAARKLILDRHNSVLRELSQKIAKSTG